MTLYSCFRTKTFNMIAPKRADLTNAKLASPFGAYKTLPAI